jgi:hypothetical protein
MMAAGVLTLGDVVGNAISAGLCGFPVTDIPCPSPAILA